MVESSTMSPTTEPEVGVSISQVRRWGPYRGVERVASHDLMNVRRRSAPRRHDGVETLDNQLRAREPEHIATLGRGILHQQRRCESLPSHDVDVILMLLTKARLTHASRCDPRRYPKYQCGPTPEGDAVAV